MAATRAPLLLSLHGLRRPLLLRLLSLGSLLLLAFFPGKSEAQAPAPAPAPAAALINRTDPVQARALNSIFRQWNLRPRNNTWNVTGDPCSGTAVDDTDFNAPSLNPSLKCVCNGGICRITQLKVYALNVVGRIADEFQNLTTIFDLNLAQNYLTGPLPAFIGNFTEMQWLSVGLNALSGPLPKELGNLSKLISFYAELKSATDEFNPRNKLGEGGFGPVAFFPDRRWTTQHRRRRGRRSRGRRSRSSGNRGEGRR